MGKTLNHYSQQIKALVPDSLALDRARKLGLLLLEAKAAVQAAGRRWSDWLEADCSLSARTAQRFMTVAKRWDEPAFAEARQQRPDLPLREADKLLASTSTRKRPESRTSGTQEAQHSDHCVYYYCPVCTIPYASSLLEKKPVIRGLLCSGSLAHPHPPTATVPSLLIVDGRQLTITPRDTSSYPLLPVIAALLKRLCPALIDAGMQISGIEASGGGSYIRIRGDAEPTDRMPSSVSFEIDRNGLMREVFIGQACAGNVMAVAHDGIEYRGRSHGYRHIWQALEEHIHWQGESVPPLVPDDGAVASATEAHPPKQEPKPAAVAPVALGDRYPVATPAESLERLQRDITQHGSQAALSRALNHKSPSGVCRHVERLQRLVDTERAAAA